MLSTNLVLPLLALGMYSHCHNINLANNTSLLIIVLALALQQREITKIEDGMNGDSNTTNTFSRSTNTTFNSNNGQTTFTSSSNFPSTQWSTCPFSNNGTVWTNSGWNTCPCQNNTWQTFSTPSFSTQSCQNGHCFVTQGSGNTIF